MIGIYLICFIVFPIAVFINAHKTYSVGRFLDKQDVDVIKGIATCFVILSHLTIQLGPMDGYNRILNIFNVMGGMGVLLFFFVSGYGLFNGYKDKRVDVIFWKKRLIKMYLPCVIIQLIFYLIVSYVNQTFNIFDIIFKSMFGAWFIDVILVQYFIFFIAWKITKGKSESWIALSFFISMIAALVFIECGFNARWYNGLMLFPFGMLIAYKEEKLIGQMERRWKIFFYMSGIMFLLLGWVFVLFKESFVVINVVKTFSGMSLSLMFCILFLRIRLCSKIMLYMGKRSLYFYLVHVNILYILLLIEKMSGILIFYLVFILTFTIVEFFNRLNFADRK